MNTEKKEIPRVLGCYTSGNKGPLLFITGGVHGNEPSGVIAIEKVFKVLNQLRPTIQGKIVGIAGNRSGLQQKVRYIDEDLNRTWTINNIENFSIDSHEKREMFDIINVISKYQREKDFTAQYFLDCHTTSADTDPFISVQEVNNNDEWAHRFPTYIIRGFSDLVKGCIDHYESRIGITGFVFEAGQHDSEKSIENHEGMIWLVIKEACGLDLSLLPNFPECVTRFSKENAKGQKTFEILYRYPLDNGDTFKMEPGYKNFQPIKKGELLAMHNGQEVRSEWDAYIHMPLYQAQGNDGFFVVKEV